jgi:hypothetical protein
LLVRRTLVVLLMLCAATAPIWPRTTPPSVSQTGISDSGLFRLIVDEVAAGKPYYPSLSRALHTNGYPTQSAFNYRQPTIYLALAWLGTKACTLLLLFAMALLVFRVWKQLSQLALITVGHTCLFVTAASAIFFAENWAGVLILLSLLAAMRSRTMLSVGWAVAALSIRELAAPYCVAMATLAMIERRWRDLAIWVAGGLVYMAFFTLHARLALEARPADGIAHLNSWVAFGGPLFLVDTLKFHGVMALFPEWGRALILSILMLAPWAPTMPRPLRAAGLAYLLFFSVAGQPFNAYWGGLTAPLLGCWFLYVVDGARTVFAASARPVDTREGHTFF